MENVSNLKKKIKINKHVKILSMNVVCNKIWYSKHQSRCASNASQMSLSITNWWYIACLSQLVRRDILTLFSILLPLFAYFHVVFGNLERHGPEFTIEPPTTVQLSNNTGTVVHCAAVGQPNPRIYWLGNDNTELETISKLRKCTPDGSLTFSPFAANEYRQDVHNAIYKCVAVNTIGSIISRSVRVRANIQQNYEIQVYDDFVIRGNIGVLRCHIPSFVRDFIEFLNWIRNDGVVLNIKNTFNSSIGERYTIFSTGELHINQVDSILDSQYNYKCQTINKMNGEIKQSTNSGRLIITDPHSNVPPKITDRKSYIVVNEGENVILPCASQGSPVPQTNWYKIATSKNISISNHIKNDLRKALPSVKKIRILNNSLNFAFNLQDQKMFQWNFNLIIKNTQLSDSGKYVCIVNSPVGEDTIETDLLVRSPLSATIVPKLIVTQENAENVQINCTLRGNPIRKIIWFKNGHPLTSSSNDRVKILNEKLIFRQIKREDSAMYQCIVLNEFNSSSSSTELSLLDEPARLIETFSSDTLLLKPGDKLSLKCVAIGNPLPQITWTLDGQPINEQLRLRVGDYVNSDGFVNSFVNISSVQVEDSGVYECSAINLLNSINTNNNLFNSDFMWPFDQHISNSNRFYTYNSFLNSNDLLNNGVIARHRARVNVIGQLMIRKMSNVTIVSGDTLVLHCPVLGYPISEIRWFKNNVRLPENHKQHVFHNGTLIIRQVEKNLDEDEYSCVAYDGLDASSHYEQIYLDAQQKAYLSQIKQNNYNKLSVSENVYVKIIVAPLISPFAAPPNLREGMRNMLTCSVLEGDPPFRIEWFKDGKSIHQIIDARDQLNEITNNFASRFKVASNNEFSSTLFFKNVSYEDNGNYTCIISNSVASANHTVNMMVKVPPKWVQIPSDTEAIVGQDLLLHCQASGYPNVRTWWEFQSTSQNLIYHSNSNLNSLSSSNNVNQLKTNSHSSTHSNSAASTKTTYQHVISNSHIHTLENGTLIIREVTKSDEGQYLCQATNGVGSGISKVITLNIHVPAHFKNSFSTETIHKGSNLQIVCEAFGEPPLSISWCKDRVPFELSKEPRYQLIEQDVNTLNSKSKSSKEDLNQNLFSTYTNSKKYNSKNSYINILRINETNRKDSALFTCVASNLYGKDEYNVQIILQEPPDKPENVKLSHIESRIATLTWTIPYSGNSLIISHQAQYKFLHETWASSTKLNQDSEQQQSYQIESSAGNVNMIILRKLKPLTAYEVRVRCENSLGWSSFSDVVQFLTKEEAPNQPPTLVHVFPSSSRVLQVTFKAPDLDENNSKTIIKGYYIGYRILNQPNMNTIKSNSNELIYTFKTVQLAEISNENTEKPYEIKLNDLRRATRYGIIVQAFNDKGSGPACDEIIGETLLNDPPPAPILSIGIITHNSFQLKWTFADVTFNSQLQAATLLEHQIVNIDSESDSITLNNEQQSLSTLSSNLLTNHGNTSSILSYSNVTINNIDQNQAQIPLSRESLITGYYLHYKSHKSNWEEKQLNGNLNSFIFKNLLCGTYYQFYIIAYNNVDKGEPSQVVSARTKGTEPKAPSFKEFIQCNSTVAILNMKKWRKNGCEIHSFIVQYRLLQKPIKNNLIENELRIGQNQNDLSSSMNSINKKSKSNQPNLFHRESASSGQNDWILISNNILADGRNVEIFELQPASWYSLLIGAQTDMGLSEKEYTFSTLTIDGATIAPFDANELGQNRLKYTSYSLMVPTLSASTLLIIVITVGLLSLCKKTNHLTLSRNNVDQLNSSNLTSVQHLNAFNTLGSYGQTTISPNSNCAHFDILREHCEHLSKNINLHEEHVLIENNCNFVSSSNTQNLQLGFQQQANLLNSNSNAGLTTSTSNHGNTYTINTFDHPTQPILMNNLMSNLDQQCNTISKDVNNLESNSSNQIQQCAQPVSFNNNQLDYDMVCKKSNLQNLNPNLITATCPQHNYAHSHNTNSQTSNCSSLTQRQAQLKKFNNDLQQTFAFDRFNNTPTNSDHTYDIPIPPKWV